MSKTYTWRKALEKLRGEPKEEEAPQRKTGRCECGCGAFRHRIEKRKLIRICVECAREEVF